MKELKHLKIRTNRYGTNSLKWDQYNDPDILAMGVADMDFYAPEPVRQALIKCAEEGFFAYAGKTESYYQAIENWYQRKYGWEIKREWLTNVPGVWTGMRICIESFTEPGDALLVHSPHFHPIPSIVEGSRRRLVFNPMVLEGDRYEVDFESMEKTIVEENVKAFIMINPQNPTGRVFTREELSKMGEICQKHHVVIISDEVHGNILFDGCKHTPAGMVKEMEQLCAVITAPSKGYNLQGLTYCILVIPNAEMHEKFEVGRHGYDMNFATNVFSMAAIEAAYEQCDEWLEECNAYVEDNLNYLNELLSRNIDGKVSTILSQVEVDKDDPAFENPTKPIGRFLTKEEADENERNGIRCMEDAGRGYRIVVASPMPKRIRELQTIKTLVDAGHIVITCGGGGIPVVSDEEGRLVGVNAVIDKDNASGLLASQLGADHLVILTAVEKVAINWGKENQEWLSDLTVEQAKEYIAQEQFAKGSMLPKVEAAIRFAESGKGRHALITLLDKAAAGIAGETGTVIRS